EAADADVDDRESGGRGLAHERESEAAGAAGFFVKRCSVPLSSRLMLARCRKITKALMMIARTSTGSGRPVSQAASGTATAATIEASETMREAKKATSQAARPMRVTSGINTTRPPAEVATPLPPLKRVKQEKLCPMTAPARPAS